MITPGTNISFHDLPSWMAGARELHRRHLSRGSRHNGLNACAHWHALDETIARRWIDAADRQLAQSFHDMLQTSKRRCEPWGKGSRGHRAGKWELLNMAVKNRLTMITREEDRATWSGHNSNAAAAA